MTAVSAQSGRMTLALHQNTSLPAGYRGSLEGWSRAGISGAEIVAEQLDEFLRTNTAAAARRLFADLNLTPVAGASRVNELWEPHPGNVAARESFRRRCELFASVGLTRIYSPTGTTGTFTEDDYKVGADNMRAVGEIASQFDMTAMVEAVRASTFISTLPTLLRMTRAAAHPHLKPLLDCYHFWSGNNKLEDLDLIQPGEIGHMHFQDVPDIPRELLDNTTRIIPGDGISPLTTILGKVAGTGYSGALSVELFAPRFRQGDPFEVASEIRRKSEAVMRQAGVL
ncbi:MAG: sugar phosphate isomerase/epimerase [Acidobacteria bacterium]|nr:sugar phosphate isomerase/epimerase [Acidobacteriota bacterium]